VFVFYSWHHRITAGALLTHHLKTDCTIVQRGQTFDA